MGDHLEYDATAAAMAAHASRLAELDIDLIGGRGGSTPAHIAVHAVLNAVGRLVSVAGPRPTDRPNSSFIQGSSGESRRR